MPENQWRSSWPFYQSLSCKLFPSYPPPPECSVEDKRQDLYYKEMRKVVIVSSSHEASLYLRGTPYSGGANFGCFFEGRWPQHRSDRRGGLHQPSGNQRLLLIWSVLLRHSYPSSFKSNQLTGFKELYVCLLPIKISEDFYSVEWEITVWQVEHVVTYFNI